jgi:hypothetical protein
MVKVWWTDHEQRTRVDGLLPLETWPLSGRDNCRRPTKERADMGEAGVGSVTQTRGMLLLNQQKL